MKFLPCLMKRSLFLLLTPAFFSLLHAEDATLADRMMCNDGDEAALLALWDKGVRPAPEERAGMMSAAVFRNSPELLRRLLAEQYPVEEALSSVVYAAQEKGCRWEEMLGLLLDAGAEVDAHGEDEPTALWVAASKLPRPAMASIAELLLSRGADASIRYGNLSAADFIAAQPQLAARWRAEGYRIEVAPAALKPGEPLEQQREEIIRMALIGADAAAIAPQLEEALSEQSMQEATAEALMLLVRADAERAARVVQMLLECNPDVPAEVAQREPALRVPAARVLELAAQDPYMSYPLVSLLWCSEAGEADIEALLESADPGTRAGAWTARLRRAGLPVAEGEEVAAWLEQRGLQSGNMAPAVQLALRLTSWDLYFRGEMSGAEKEAFVRACEQLNLPAVQEALTAEDADVFYDPACFYAVQEAVSRFIWEHRAAFLDAAK